MLLQNKTTANKLTELIISSLLPVNTDQYSMLLRSSVTCHTWRTAAAGWLYHATRRTSSFRPSGPNPPVPKALSFGSCNSHFRTGSTWVNPAQLPRYFVYGLQKGEMALGTGKLQKELRFCCCLCLPI